MDHFFYASHIRHNSFNYLNDFSYSSHICKVCFPLGPLLSLMHQARAAIDNNLFSLFRKYYALSFLLKTLKRRRIDVFKLKNWHYLSYEGHFYVCVNRKTMRFWNFKGAFGSFRTFHRVETCYNWTSSNVVASLSCLQICFDHNWC